MTFSTKAEEDALMASSKQVEHREGFHMKERSVHTGQQPPGHLHVHLGVTLHARCSAAVDGDV